MSKYFVNPVNGQYESTAYKAPTHSNLMRSIGRHDLADELDKNKKKKPVNALDVASAKGRDILAEQMTYKFDASIGEFINGMGKRIKNAAEAIKENEQIAEIAPGGEGSKFEAEHRAAITKASKYLREPTKIKKPLRDIEQPFGSIINNLKKPVAQRVGATRKAKGTPFEKYNKEMNDIDVIFSAADPKEKMGMRKRYKDYDFSKRKFKEDIAKEEILKTPISSSPPVPPKPVEVPSVDVRELIKQRANSRAATERAQSVKEYGAHGLGHLRLQMRGLDD